MAVPLPDLSLGTFILEGNVKVFVIQVTGLPCLRLCHEHRGKLRHRENKDPRRAGSRNGEDAGCKHAARSLSHCTSPQASSSCARAPGVCLHAKHLSPGQCLQGDIILCDRDTEECGPCPTWKPVWVGKVRKSCETAGSVVGNWSLSAEATSVPYRSLLPDLRERAHILGKSFIHTWKV